MGSRDEVAGVEADLSEAESTVAREPLGQRIFDLEQPRYRGMPIIDVHQPGYAYFLYRRHADTREMQPGTVGRSSSSGLLMMMEHSGTHVDALCHQAEDLTIHGGRASAELERSDGFTESDAASIPVFFHSGVLLDVARHRRVPALGERELIDAAELAECAERQGTPVPEGGVVLVRTGNGANWHDPEIYLSGPGMAADASEWLAERGVAAVGADNVAWDVPGYVDEELDCDLPGHLILLVRSGVYIFENLSLDELAAAEVRSFTFVAVPLKLVGATGSPIRPLAVVEGGSADDER